jgi:ubiquinone/menaquinone biosynthesis C-methylase UbiE
MRKDDVLQFFDSYAGRVLRWERHFQFYHDAVKQLLKELVPSGSRVMDLGCGDGDKLAVLKPMEGFGIDISPNMVALAKKRHPELRFEVADVEEAGLQEQEYDHIIAVNLMEYLEDIPKFCEQLGKVGVPESRFCVLNFNPIYEPVLKFLERIGVKERRQFENRMDIRDISNLLELHGFSLIEWGAKIVLPFLMTGTGRRRYKSGRRFFNPFCMLQYGIYGCCSEGRTRMDYSCSVIIPCYNEAKNVEECVRRIPDFSSGLEIIIVDDGSSDATAQTAFRLAEMDTRVKVVSYSRNQGKGYAVRRGFDTASGDVFIILDCDMSVPPEDVPMFFDAIDFGMARAVNGSRLVYQMEEQAMRTLNFYGNIFFGWAFSVIFGKRVTDTLCGTKAILGEDYKKIEMGKDPWGDFDILFGLAKLGIVPMEIPVRYRARTGGRSKMKTFRHGFHLFKMLIRGIGETGIR